MRNPPATGIDVLLNNPDLLARLSKKKIGLIANQSSLTKDYRLSATELQRKVGSAFVAILTPEHGWSGLIAEGVSIGNGFDPHLGLPVVSLYGDEATWLHFIQTTDIDTLIIDLQDVGLRCYTYGLTCAKVFDALKGISLEIIVCDRPNPLGPDRKGPILEPHLRSVVGHFEIPFQHGQTIGQILQDYHTGGSPFSIVPCMTYHVPYTYPWIPPSPNLPSWSSVLLYPGLVMLEGTNVSEGRGTTLPFTSLGAPNLDHYKLVDFINTTQENGIRARPITFTPQSGKCVGVECQGAHLFITNLKTLDAFSLGLAILGFLKENYVDFEWIPIKNKDIYFIDYLLGTINIRKKIDLLIKN